MPGSGILGVGRPVSLTALVYVPVIVAAALTTIRMADPELVDPKAIEDQGQHAHGLWVPERHIILPEDPYSLPGKSVMNLKNIMSCRRC